MKDYFKPAELECKCGCGGTVDPRFHSFLNRVREVSGVPMVLSSAFRCEAHDKAEGGKGAHTTGKAADVLCSGREAYKIMKAAISLGCTGIGVSQKGDHSKRFLHLDVTEGETRPWIWSY